MTFYSPLRYPGGKNKLSSFIAKVCIDNHINGHYVEPYSGGASVALFLLIEGYVNKITINDKDRSIYAFWHCVLRDTKKLCQLIHDAEITIENWQKQVEIQKNKKSVSLLELGFSTLFLNRTNRSGIIRAGVMGGINQTGNYKMDCRFNKEDIINRIKVIAKHKKNIKLYNKDAIKLIDLIEKQSNNNTIFYFDPPYYLKAESLYMNHYSHKNHKIVSDRISKINNIKWIVSYDNDENIQKLYQNFRSKEFTFNHSAYESRVGKEILFFSPEINEPEINEYNPVNFRLKKRENINQIIYKVNRNKTKKTSTK